MGQLTHRDLARLEGVHPGLRKVVLLAADLCPIPFMVVEGVRSLETCHAYWGKGRTVRECVSVGVDAKHARPGLKKVTWTLNSKHKKQADGHGHAVDLLPHPYDWKIEDPKNTPEIDDAFAKLNKAMQEAAVKCAVGLRWGANWDGDRQIREKGETDNPHWELVP